ncbi:MAG: amino acid adenylation domain-containing protein [Candidatus Binatia bacterium]|jgi:D-alanine--poly(phosphoribitol) ligase subunit 1
MLAQIKASIDKFRQRPAFFIRNTFFSYNDLGQTVSRIRKAIEQHALPSERMIGFLTYDDFETYCSAVAVLFTKFAFVPIDPANPLDRNVSIIEQAQIKTLLSSVNDTNIRTHCESRGIQFITTSELQHSEVTLSLPEVRQSDLAYLLFTSGSTGVPKGVPLSRRNLYEFMNAFIALGYDINENDRVLQMFDLTFDLSLMSYLAPLCRGACVYTVPPGGIKYADIYTLLDEQRITVALMVPSILAHLRPYLDEIRLPDMRYSMFCGEALYADVASDWMKCVPNARVQNVYGPTEATIFCLAYDMSRKGSIKNFNSIVCIGKPMDNMAATVVDESLKPVRRGEKGELCLTGFQLTDGYWRNPEKNREAFFTLLEDGVERRYYRTGDVAFVDGEGDFMFAGRLDHQVKIQGFRVELSEIEHHAREFASTNNVAAVASDGSDAGHVMIHLFVENFPGRVEEIERYLETKVPKYMIPSEIHNITAFPLNVNGKIDRRALLKAVKDRQG